METCQRSDLPYFLLIVLIQCIPVSQMCLLLTRAHCLQFYAWDFQIILAAVTFPFQSSSFSFYTTVRSYKLRPQPALFVSNLPEKSALTLKNPN